MPTFTPKILWQFGAITTTVLAIILFGLLKIERHHNNTLTTKYEDLLEARATFKAEVEAAANAAVVEAHNEAERLRIHYATLQKENSRELEARLAGAHARADDYRKRLLADAQAGNNPGSPGHAGVSGPAHPTGAPLGADGTPVLAETVTISAADFEIATRNAILLEGWQRWWKGVSALTPDQSEENATQDQ